MSCFNEITVFSYGDSNDTKVWSNVPFFLVHALESHNVKVNRVNIRPNRLFSAFYRLFIFPLIRMTNWRSEYHFSRTPVCQYLVRRKIKQALKKYPQADILFFIALSFYAKDLTDKPIVVYGDWPFDLHLKLFAKREPDFFESLAVKYDDRVLSSADLIIPFFQVSAQHIQKKYNISSVFFPGYAINTRISPVEKTILQAKKEHLDLLMIARKSGYSEGISCLLRAFELLQKEYSEIKLHIISVTEADFSSLPQNVYCYGYLDKNRPEQCETYYSLLSRCKALINTTPGWSGFSSMVEALCFYTPIISSEYPELSFAMGESMDCGYYCQNDPNELAQKIKLLIQDPNYDQLCRNAHDKTTGCEWNAYAGRILQKCSALLNS